MESPWEREESHRSSQGKWGQGAEAAPGKEYGRAWGRSRAQALEKSSCISSISLNNSPVSFTTRASSQNCGTFAISPPRGVLHAGCSPETVQGTSQQPRLSQAALSEPQIRRFTKDSMTLSRVGSGPQAWLTLRTLCFCY